MTAPPTFASSQEHVSRLGDVGFWSPYVAEVLERHDLADCPANNDFRSRRSWALRYGACTRYVRRVSYRTRTGRP